MVGLVYVPDGPVNGAELYFFLRHGITVLYHGPASFLHNMDRPDQTYVHYAITICTITYIMPSIMYTHTHTYILKHTLYTFWPFFLHACKQQLDYKIKHNKRQ